MRSPPHRTTSKPSGKPSALARVILLLTQHPLFFGFGIRLAVMTILPALLDDGLLLQGVRYTDIDYDVFTDAADHAAAGRSPFDRHTYRYTPFLAALLAWPINLMADGPNESGVAARKLLLRIPRPLTWWMGRRYFGRLLFCIADTACGYIIVTLRRKRRREHGQVAGVAVGQTGRDGRATNEAGDSVVVDALQNALRNPQLHDAMWWLYNPLPINICTRGSAESFVVLLPVLLTVAIATFRFGVGGGRGEVVFRAWMAGLVHGVAIHAKLYPIIYTVSFMANFSLQEQRATNTLGAKLVASASRSASVWTSTLPALEMPNGEGKGDARYTSALTSAYPFPWTDPRRLLRLVRLWFQRLFFTPASIMFLSCSLITFASLTHLAVHHYGRVALEEGFLYHLSRVDHRHNYSMHWYWIYLARGRIARTLTAKSAVVTAASSSMAVLGRVLLLPQAVLLAYASLGVAPYDLPLALFIQTFLFVAHNKVITGQYFTWYLCLLPLCSDGVVWETRQMRLALSFTGISVITWLGSAYCLEMKGMSVHLLVWSASILFFAANVKLLGTIVSGYTGQEISSREHETKRQPDEGVASKKLR